MVSCRSRDSKFGSITIYDFSFLFEFIGFPRFFPYLYLLFPQTLKWKVWLALVSFLRICFLFFSKKCACILLHNTYMYLYKLHKGGKAFKIRIQIFDMNIQMGLTEYFKIFVLTVCWKKGEWNDTILDKKVKKFCHAIFFSITP